MKSFLSLAFSALLSLPTYAGLYECSSPDAKPVLTSKVTKNISFETSIPFFMPYYKEPTINPDGKIPFLIYYAIDTEEPFMQYSVKYELAELRLACERSDKVNYAAIINSKFATWSTIQICKNKTFQEVDLRKFPALFKSLETKKRYIWEGDHTTSDTGPMSFLVRFQKENNKVFYDYPLAHPDFVHDLISFVMTEESLFPKNKFIPFLNLKSHGSKKHVLSGLHPCQVQAKTQSQQAIIDKVLNDTDKFLLSSSNYRHFLPQVKEALNKLSLGSNVAAASDSNLGEYSLGEYSLGEYSLGEYSLGDVMAGLGASEGLGAKFSFGTYHTALSSVLYRLFNDQDNNFLGFAMLESCDTNRNVNFHHQHLEFVLGIYSAKNSLWYRNLNWWSLLEKADGSSVELIKLLEIQTKKIPNIIVKDL